MRGMNWSKTAMGMLMVVLVTVQVFGQNASPKKMTREIIVSLADHKLALLENGQVVKSYPVTVGKPSTPSPVGTFTIEHRVVDPTYYHHGVVIPPGPENPVGNRWMSLSISGYGIHGTNVPSSIGKAASHGCIRLGRADIEDLFSRVRIGDKVELIAGQNQETAQIFGDGPKPPATQPTLLAAGTEPQTQPATAPAPNQAQVLNAMAKTGPATGANRDAAGTL